jgi:hypothetical protein
MSQRAPPVVATWLIERLGPVHHRESLTGDLIEQYGRGRSESWYWRQVAIAVFLARLHFVRSALAIPKAKVILRLVIECAILALGVGTLTWAATANKVPCAIGICVGTKTP